MTSPVEELVDGYMVIMQFPLYMYLLVTIDVVIIFRNHSLLLLFTDCVPRVSV